MKFKKTTAIFLILTLFMVTSVSSFAADIQLPLNDLGTFKALNSSKLTTDDMKTNVYEAVKKGEINQKYANRLIQIINKNSIAHDNKGLETDVVNSAYYNENTGAVISYSVMPYPLHGMLIMNQAGFNIIKEIVNMGGGAATIGGGVAAVAGLPLVGGLAIILGGALIMQSAFLSLQFALGKEYAVVYF